MKIVITPKGVVRQVVPDDILGAIPSSTSDTRFFLQRASHVEPWGLKWSADLSPVGGPFLGPFDSRSDALYAERMWLEEHLSQLKLKKDC